jgi:ubiquinone biosynthesis protein
MLILLPMRPNVRRRLRVKNINRTWTGSVQGAVATWSNHGSQATRSLPLPVLTRSKNSVRRPICVRMMTQVICTFLLLAQVGWGISTAHAETPRLPKQSRQQITLPTARSHYDTFKRGESGVPLMMDLLKEFEPETQKVLVRLAIAAGVQDKVSELAEVDLKKLQDFAVANGLARDQVITKEQAVSLLKGVDWSSHRPVILEMLVHQSRVLDMIPEKWGDIWVPIIHDALLFFLDHLSDDRLLDKLVGLSLLPPNTSRGAYLIEFVSKVPSLQKMGQILARNPDLAPEYREALQGLENGIHTMTRDELVQFITDDIGKTSLDKYQVSFADHILAEASVGATIRATYIPPPTTVRQQMLFKVVKPYVLVNLPEDLAILDGIAEYFTVQHDFYHLGSMPLVEVFKEIRKSLTNEINIKDEQQNFIRARQYYMKSNKVLVPEILSMSNNHVTAMQFVTGEKITSAFKGDPAKRAIMAERLSEVMTGDVIFASAPEAIFHGDPHPGNVYHVLGDPKNPYQIALLDWGLMGTFPRKDRIALMQLILGVQLADAKRLHKNVGALLENGLPQSPEKLQKIDSLIAQVLVPKAGRSSFDTLQELLFGLIEQGYATKFTLNIFIKSQITIAGELVELDPSLKQDELLEKQVTSLVKREMPKRLLCTVWFPCWNSRSYQSLLSNADVMAGRHMKKPKESKAQTAKTSTTLTLVAQP